VILRVKVMVRPVVDVKKMSITAAGIGATVAFILKDRPRMVIALKRIVQTVRQLSNNVPVCGVKGMASALAMGPAIQVTARWFVAEVTIERLARRSLLPRGDGVIVKGHGAISQTCNSILMSIWFYIGEPKRAFRVFAARCRGIRGAAITGRGTRRTSRRWTTRG